MHVCEEPMADAVDATRSAVPVGCVADSVAAGSFGRGLSIAFSVGVLVVVLVDVVVGVVSAASTVVATMVHRQCASNTA